MKNNEIVSFNETVPELSTLLEIDGAQLDIVTGGSKAPSCPNLTTCGTYTTCGVDVKIPL